MNKWKRRRAELDRKHLGSDWNSFAALPSLPAMDEYCDAAAKLDAEEEAERANPVADKVDHGQGTWIDDVIILGGLLAIATAVAWAFGLIV